MKYLVIIVFAFASLNTVAQEKKTILAAKSAHAEKSVEAKEVRTVNKPIYVSSGSKSQQPEKTVEYYDNLINAVNAKVDYIKSDQAENAKALESGWFDKMDEILLNAEEEKKKLQNPKK